MPIISCVHTDTTILIASLRLCLSLAKKAEAKEAEEPIDPKEAAKALKTKKNEFAINRLIFMLLDIDPDGLSQKMIDDLKSCYELLANIHSRQSGPKENSKSEKK